MSSGVGNDRKESTLSSPVGNGSGNSPYRPRRVGCSMPRRCRLSYARPVVGNGRQRVRPFPAHRKAESAGEPAPSSPVREWAIASLSNQDSGRLAIDVNQFATESELVAYAPQIAAHLRRTVKPIRDAITSQVHDPRYWGHWDKRTKLFEAVSRLPSFLGAAETTQSPISS